MTARECGASMTVIEENLRLGGDPGAHEQSAVLAAELAKLNHPARPDVNWGRVERSCAALFQEHGVELQSAAAYTLACAQLHGVRGLDDGLGLIGRLLGGDWERTWPLGLPVRLEILAWLFAQLRPWLRGLPLSAADTPELLCLDGRLKGLAELLQRHGQGELAALQALRSQLQGLLKRLAPDTSPVAAEVPPADQAPEGTAPEPPAPTPPPRRAPVRRPRPSAPAVAVPKRQGVAPPVEQLPPPKRRRLWVWLLLLALLTLLTGVFLWVFSLGGQGSRTLPQASSAQVVSRPVRLNGELLFPPGRAVLKPESTKVLINSLIDIKAQPGWLIVITGHSDSTGDARQNLELSRQRAAAVRDWMQRMGDIPDDCFVVSGRGASEPVASDGTEEGRNANRRVEITLTPEGGACAQQGRTAAAPPRE